MLTTRLRSLLMRTAGIDHIRRSYAQHGEDLVLGSLFPNQSTGFFVDIGAHHPKRFSNTYLLYRRGWRGINIDAAPGSMRPFRAQRPHDINLELAIDAAPGTKPFYMFHEPALSTFDQQATASAQEQGWPLKATVELPLRTLTSVLDQHLPKGRRLDLLTIDIEGLDGPVLESLNLDLYQPTVIISEMHGADCATALASTTGKHLARHGYALHSKCFLSCIWRRE